MHGEHAYKLSVLLFPVGFQGLARTVQVAVAVSVIDAAYRWPEFVFLNPG